MLLLLQLPMALSSLVTCNEKTKENKNVTKSKENKELREGSPTNNFLVGNYGLRLPLFSRVILRDGHDTYHGTSYILLRVLIQAFTGIDYMIARFSKQHRYRRQQRFLLLRTAVWYIPGTRIQALLSGILRMARGHKAACGAMFGGTEQAPKAFSG